LDISEAAEFLTDMSGDSFPILALDVNIGGKLIEESTHDVLMHSVEVLLGISHLLVDVSFDVNLWWLCHTRLAHI
jgi:hypothetical protein